MKLKIRKGIALIILSIISYAIIYFIPFAFNLPKWSFTSLAIFDYSAFFLPLIGFYLILLAMDWTDNYCKEKISKKPYFIIIFVVFCLIAFWLAVFMFNRNSFDLGGGPESLKFDFFSRLFDNSFFGFMLAGIAGWLSKCLVDFLFTEKVIKQE